MDGGVEKVARKMWIGEVEGEERFPRGRLGRIEENDKDEKEILDHVKEGKGKIGEGDKGVK